MPGYHSLTIYGHSNWFDVITSSLIGLYLELPSDVAADHEQTVREEWNRLRSPLLRIARNHPYRSQEEMQKLARATLAPGGTAPTAVALRLSLEALEEGWPKDFSRHHAELVELEMMRLTRALENIGRGYPCGTREDMQRMARDAALVQSRPRVSTDDALIQIDGFSAQLITGPVCRCYLYLPESNPEKGSGWIGYGDGSSLADAILQARADAKEKMLHLPSSLTGRDVSQRETNHHVV